MTKITLIGDSITKGVILEKGKVKKLETNAIEIVEKQLNIEIDNQSTFGQSLKRAYEKKLFDKYFDSINPLDNNILIVSLGGNDSGFDWVQVGLNPHHVHTSKTSLLEYKTNLNSITMKAKSLNVTLIYSTLFPLDSNLYFNNVLAYVADKSKILEFFQNDITNIYRYQECFSDVVYKHAKENNLILIDIRTPFLLDVAFLDYLSEDGVHPNILGQQKIASIYLKTLIKKTNYF